MVCCQTMHINLDPASFRKVERFYHFDRIAFYDTAQWHRLLHLPYLCRESPPSTRTGSLSCLNKYSTTVVRLRVVRGHGTTVPPCLSYPYSGPNVWQAR